MSIKVGKVTLITLTEAGKRFGVSYMTLHRAIKRGELKGIHLARRTLVKPEDVRKWVEKFYNREMAERVKKRWQKKETKKKTQKA